ncbi:MAG: DUF3857 domain-containing protein [Bacteroidales bacterium]
MKYTIQKYILLLIGAAIISSCTSPTKEDPNADAVYKSITETYTLHPNGSLTKEYQHQLKLKSFYAFNRLHGESFIVFHPKTQQVEVLKSETTMADGKTVVSPENAYNEVLPRFAAGAPPYNHLRELVVTHIGLEPESTIDFQYKVETQKDFLPFLMKKIELQKESPIEDYSIIIKIPIEEELHYNLSHLDKIPLVSTKGDYRIFKWQFSNLPALSGEPHQPHDKVHIPQLSVSTANVEEAMQWLAEQQPGLSDNMKAAIEVAFTAGMSPYDKAEALQRMFISEMNTFNIPMEYTGYKVRKGAEIWKDNGATPREKALIMAEILQLHNIDATPVYSYQKIGQEPVGNFENLGHAYVQINHENQRFYLSTTHPGTIEKEVVEQMPLINLTTGKLQELEPDKVHKSLKMVSKVTIDKNLQAKGTQQLSYSGIAVNAWNLYADTNYGSKRLAPFGKESTIEEVEASKTKHQVTGTVAINKEAPIHQTGDVYTLTLPTFPKGFNAMHLKGLNDSRTTPFAIETGVTESYDFELELTPNMKWLALPKPVEIANDAGEVTIIFSQKGNTLHIVKKLKLAQTTVLPEHYEAFRSLIKTWLHPQHQEVLFKQE